VIGYYKGGEIYVRRTTSRGRGPYFQLVRSYRQEGKVRQEVLVHLGMHEKPQDALAAWPSEVAHLRKIGRVEQADKLEANLEKLKALVAAEERKG
jgi:fatty acid-binding protein DegV